MKIKRSDLKTGMWMLLGEKILSGDRFTILVNRARLFDYRNAPLSKSVLYHHSQRSNPYTLTPHQITKLSPLTAKFRSRLSGDYHTHSFRVNEITRIFDKHTDFILWRDEFLKHEREHIKALHQVIKQDRTFWIARRNELKHYKRPDDLKKVKKIS